MLELNGRFPQKRPTGKCLNPKRCLIVASSRQRKKGKKNPSLKTFQTWLGENMEKGKENVWVFFFFFMCSVLLAPYCQKILESQQCAMWNFKNKFLEQSKLLAMKIRLSQCASTEQIWIQASLMFMLNIRVMRKRTEGGEITMIAQEWWVNKVGRKWVGENQKDLQSPNISMVKDGLYVEQSTSLRVINKATYFCGKSNVQGLGTWFLKCNFPYGTS